MENEQDLLMTDESLGMIKSEAEKVALEVLRPDLSKLKDTLQKVANFKRKYNLKKITPTGIDDKEGRKKLHEACTDMQKTRTASEEDRKTTVKPFSDCVSFINKNFKNVAAMIAVVEDPAYELKKKLDNAEADEKARVKREQAERVNKRVEELINIGCSFNSEYYSAGSLELDVPEINIGIADIEVMSEELFANFVIQVIGSVHSVNEKKKEKKAKLAAEAEEALLKDLAEKEKLAAEQKKVADDLLKIQQEQEDMRKEKEEIIKMRLEARGSQLEAIEMQCVGTRYEFEGLYLDLEYIGKLNKEDWAKVLLDYTILIADSKIEIQKEKEAKEKKAATLIARSKQLDDLGLKFHLGFKSYSFPGIAITTEIDVFDEVQWNDLIETITPKIAAHNEAVAKQVIEDARIEALKVANKTAADQAEKLAKANDNVKYSNVIAQLQAITFPEMKSKLYKNKVSIINEFIEALVTDNQKV